jgi:hypothetical protein
VAVGRAWYLKVRITNPWRRRHYVPSKRRSTLHYPVHCVTSQNTRNLNTNALKLISRELLLIFREIVLKSGSLNLLEPSRPLQACNLIALPLPCTCTTINTWHCATRIAGSNNTNTILTQTHPSPTFKTCPLQIHPRARPLKSSKRKFSQSFPHQCFVLITCLLNDSQISWPPWRHYPTVSANSR